MRFFKDTTYDFLKYRKIAFLLSGLVIGAGIISLIAHGGPRLSIDFVGGSIIQVKFDRPVSLAEVRSALAPLDTLKAGAFELQNFEGRDEVLIRVPRFTSGESVSPLVEAVLKERLPDLSVSIEREESVGPKIGQVLERKALLAIFYSLIGLLIYISWRFEFRFAVAAIVALFHDVMVTVGAFSLTNREVSLAVLAAILTIIGYSLNDTIVIMDRIRENRRVMRREGFVEIVNTSVNQTLNRTINTSLTTLLVVMMLFIYGGGIIHDFAFALIVGIIAGTYSTVFIANPIVVEWYKRAAAKERG